MRYLTPVLFLAAVFAVADRSPAQPALEVRGVTAKVKLEEVISGHLIELNGKFKLRVTEVNFAPQAYLGTHHHAGPGIRYVVAGKLTFAQAGTTTTYHAGDYFYESGNLAHIAQNKTGAPLRVIFFEVIPADWQGPTVITPRTY